MNSFYNVLVIGAGISGIGAGHYLKKIVQIRALLSLKIETLLVGHGIYLSIQE